jgi:hypothetical protein
MSHLPLREDFHENSSVLKCFLFLFSNGHPLFASHLPQIMNVILTMATQQELQPGNLFMFFFFYLSIFYFYTIRLKRFMFVFAEQKPMINELMAHIASGFPDLYNGWASALPAEVQQKLKEVVA